jgi:hypothetical protein
LVTDLQPLGTWRVYTSRTLQRLHCLVKGQPLQRFVKKVKFMPY